MIDFIVNDGAVKIAESLIREYHPHLIGLNIAHLTKIKPPAKSRKRARIGKKIVMAKTSRISDKMRTLMTTSWQFVVEYDNNIWQELSQTEKNALVDHELSHCGNDADGAYLKSHGLEEFAAIAKRHGCWKSDIREFAEAVDEKFHKEASTQ